ncbi:hypothetical protein HAX54_001405, partial [Datura stramonium]|nr:hypothetical protein [Datura stramonium]
PPAGRRWLWSIPNLLINAGGSSTLRGSTTAFHQCILSTSRWPYKGKASMRNINIPSLSSYEAHCVALCHFGLAGMGQHYVSFKEKRSIHAEAEVEVESFKTTFPNIYYQIGMRYWGPFTILVDPYFPELVWDFYATYRARKSTPNTKDEQIQYHACHLCGCMDK